MRRKLRLAQAGAPTPKKGTYTKKCGKKTVFGISAAEAKSKNRKCLAKGGDFWRANRCIRGKSYGGGCRKYYIAKSQIRTKKV